MNVYMYQAALYCEECGKAIREELTNEGKAPECPENESSFDSDDFPKGPYSDGGGEADTPQHCLDCNCFLENPLTSDGLDYTKDAIDRAQNYAKAGILTVSEVVKGWAKFYDLPLTNNDEAENGCPECGSSEYNGTETVCLACSVRAAQDLGLR